VSLLDVNEVGALWAQVLVFEFFFGRVRHRVT